MIKRRKPIRKVSLRQAKLNGQWQKVKREFLKEHPVCGLIHLGLDCCTQKATHVHHRRGRGKFLLDEAFLLPVCSICHDFIHRNPKWATEHGYMVSRLSRA